MAALRWNRESLKCRDHHLKWKLLLTKFTPMISHKRDCVGYNEFCQIVGREVFLNFFLIKTKIPLHLNPSIVLKNP
jgi:hypothetical protein